VLRAPPDRKVTPKEKAAILLASLGSEVSSEILKHMPDNEVQELATEIAKLGRVPSSVREQVIEEFREMVMAQEYITEGGMDSAKDILQRAFGDSKAEDLIKKVIHTLNVMPFDSIRNVDPTQLLNLIVSEHPQTIALVLAYLAPEQAASVLSGLPQELAADVARRIATMDRTGPDVVKEVEAILQRRLSAVGSHDLSSAGGVKALVEVLNWVDRATEKTIIENLSESSPELAEEVKQMMFTFDDIAVLDDRAIQLVLREIDTKELAPALKVVKEEVKNKILKNLSERAQTMLQEDMEFMGPVRLRTVEEAQQRIVNVIRRLEEAGEIVIARGGEDELVV
jgi:flagellar motor switch protein FliG